MTPPPADRERLRADHVILRRLGHWTEAHEIDLRARHSSVVLDLRSPQVPENLEITAELDHATLTLLVPDHADVDTDDLTWTGKGRVHDRGGDGAHEQVRVTGHAHDSQVRVRRSGSAQITAMLTHEYLADLRASRREGRYPTVDDPRRAPRPGEGRDPRSAK
jgi:hypothetical protein